MSNIDACLSSNTVEWYTPPSILEYVYRYFGERGVTLDPCSNPGEPNVKAEHHYTKDDNGLSHEWTGNVFCNPPYGKNEIPLWINKALASDAITLLLVPSRTSNRWWSNLDSCPVCFVRGRITFVGATASAPFPSAIFLILPDSMSVQSMHMCCLRFYKTFSDLGSVRF